MKVQSGIVHFDLRITMVVSERIAISIHQSFHFAVSWLMPEVRSECTPPSFEEGQYPG